MEEIELGLKKRVNFRKTLQKIGPDFGPPWTEMQDRIWTEFLLKNSVMISVQPGPKP